MKNTDPRWAPVVVKTAGELKQLLTEVPDDTPVVRLTNGYYTVNKQDVSVWLGKLTIDDPEHNPENAVECLRF